jgi:hypothetical protein
VRATEARIGATVRVDKDYRKHPKLRGSVGSIKQRYGAPNYMALEVRFEDGQYEAVLVRGAGAGKVAILPVLLAAHLSKEVVRASKPEMGSESAPTGAQRPPRNMLAKRVR